jgi:hypothetical protein
MPKLKIMSLSSTQTPVNGAVLDMPYVFGVSIRQLWSNIELAPGVFDWTFLDSEISRIRAKSKKVMLRPVMGGQNVPSWLFSLGATSYSTIGPDGTRTTIVPWWDTVYVGRAKFFLEALGARYKTKVHTLVLPIGNAFTAEMNIWVNTSDGDLDELMALGYSFDGMINAFVDLLTSASNAFPNSLCTVAIGPASADLVGADRYLPAKTLWQKASPILGSMLYFQANDVQYYAPLLDKPSERWKVLQSVSPQVGGQMLWFVSGDTTYRMTQGDSTIPPEDVLRQAIQNGVNFHARHLEIYQRDVLAFPSVIQWGSQLAV